MVVIEGRSTFFHSSIPTQAVDDSQAQATEKQVCDTNVEKKERNMIKSVEKKMTVQVSGKSDNESLLTQPLDVAADLVPPSVL